MRTRSILAALAALPLLAASAAAQSDINLLEWLYPGGGQGIQAPLPAPPAVPAAPLIPGTNPAAHAQLIQRLQYDVAVAQREFQEAAQSGDADLIREKLDALQIAQYRLGVAQGTIQPTAGPFNGRFFPSFTSGDMVSALAPQRPGEPPPAPSDNSFLPGEMRRIVFHRQYGALRSPGHITVVIGQDGGATDPKHVVVPNLFSSLDPSSVLKAHYNIKEENNSEEANDAEFYPGRRPNPLNPDQMVDAWLFDQVRGKEPRKVRTFLVDIRSFRDSEGKEWDAVHDASNIRFARIRQETYTGDDGEVTQRAYYRESDFHLEGRDPFAIASMVQGTYQGLPALVLRSGSGPNAEPIFFFVFSSWRPQSSGVDNSAKAAMGRYLDAWVTAKPWRDVTGISHNFVVPDDDE